jgi:peptidoglycan hydrolase-like protein with peptidoglycan-binding domain
MLKTLNFFSVGVTGYFGKITKNSVIGFQKSEGLAADGIVGPNTADALHNRENPKLQSMVAEPESTVMTAKASRSGDRENILLPWFNGAEDIFKVGTNAIVTDVETGISFHVRRTGGVNHSDTETLSKEDTALLKKICGGEWNWERRAVLVTVEGHKIAASMTGMPHAGRDDKPARIVVGGRSDGYGVGLNYDSVKGNAMDGHFDIHFLNSRTHGTNRVDERHQSMIRKAAESYMN